MVLSYLLEAAADPGRRHKQNIPREGAIRRQHLLPAAAGVLVALALASPTSAAAPDQQDPDWPCMQQLVPKIESGMIWSGPSLDKVEGNWQTDPDVASLAATLAAQRTPVDVAEKKVGEFASKLPDEQRQQKLTLLFKGTLEVLNGERRRVIASIKRYARGQRALAARIEEENRKINGVELTAVGNAEDNKTPAMEQRDWDLRIFNDRRRMLKNVCDEPTKLDRRAYTIARTIQNHLSTP